MRSYLLLGLGARGHDFRDDRWPVPHGAITWVRYLDPDNPDPPTTAWSLEEAQAAGQCGDRATDDYLDFAPDAGRFLIELDESLDEQGAMETAWAIADGVAGLLAIANGALGIDVHIVEISSDVAVGRVVSRDDVESGREELELPWVRRESAWHLAPGRARHVMERVAAVLTNGHAVEQGPFPAITYFRLSVFDFAFTPDDVCWVLAHRDDRPPTYYACARLEESFHNAFKAVEALLGGEPRWKLDALRKRLSKHLIDPDRVPHLPDGRGETVVQRLLEQRCARDKKSAHGGCTGDDRRLSFYDLMEMQWIASEMI